LANIHPKWYLSSAHHNITACTDLLGLPLPSSNSFVRQLLESYLPTAIGTFIEPFWLVLNRNLCLLQPFESLRKGRAKGENSVDLDYSSLPPQLVIGKALLSKHYLLAAVCTMTLLANVLAVSLSGLLFENSVDHPVPIRFQRTFDAKFQAVNGSAPAFVAKGGTIEPFYIATSNQTAHTELPPWTDSKQFYLPFSTGPQTRNQSWSYRATTQTIGAQLSCNPLSSASTFVVAGTQFDKLGFADILSTGNLTVSLTRDQSEVVCVPRATAQEGRDSQEVERIIDRPTGSCGYEFTYALDGLGNSSASDAQFCREHIAVGWVRAQLVNGTLLPGTNYTDFLPSVVTSYNSTIIICRGEIVSGTADTTVDSNGYVKATQMMNASTSAGNNLFSTTSSDVLGQAHQFILNRGTTWHNDSFPSDFGNYLIGQVTNSSRLVDPNTPPPDVHEVVQPFAQLYMQLFATWIGRNSDQLLVRATNSNVQGHVIQPTVRIFMSKPMLFIAETILGMYIIVTIVLYIQRPWKILCRLPTSPASLIAFFAASNAVKDFRGTAGMNPQERRQHLHGMNNRYGFGTFIGTDGEVHVGVEKHPFLAPLTREATGLSRQDTVGSSRSVADNWWAKVQEWKSGKVREGGWI
jgi:hypothetical protein